MKKYYSIFLITHTLLLLYMMLFGFGRNPGIQKNIQLVPFFTISEIFSEFRNYKQFGINILGNIILFIPFGFLGMISEKFKNPKILFTTFIISICFVEFLQFISQRGFADIDDVILNTTGVLIGFILYRKYLNN